MNPNLPYDTTDEDEYVITVVNPKEKPMAAKKKTAKRKASKKTAKRKASKKTAKRKASKKTAKRKATKKTAKRKTTKKKATKKTAKRKTAKKAAKRKTAKRVSKWEVYSERDIEAAREAYEKAREEYNKARGRLGGMVAVREYDAVKRKGKRGGGRFAGRFKPSEIDSKKFDRYPNPETARDREALKRRIRRVLEEQEREGGRVLPNPVRPSMRKRRVARNMGGKPEIPPAVRARVKAKLRKNAKKVKKNPSTPAPSVNTLVKELKKMVG